MILFLTVVALCASTWRATRLLVKDDLPIVKRPRDAIVARAGRGLETGHLRWYGELITCPWCVSVWIAAAFTLVTDLLVGLPVPVLMFGLAAAVAASYEDLTTRNACPEVDLQELIVNALKQPEWQTYTAERLAALHKVHTPQGVYSVDATARE